MRHIRRFSGTPGGGASPPTTENQLRQPSSPVDEGVGEIIESLAGERPSSLNAYFVFTSDNGFFTGEHRLPGARYLPYEPWVARAADDSRPRPWGPGPGEAELVSDDDLAPTILE